MSDNEKLEKWLSEHDGNERCKYCRYDDGCPHGIACYGGSPIEPACCYYDIKDYLDTEAILKDLEEENK